MNQPVGWDLYGALVRSAMSVLLRWNGSAEFVADGRQDSGSGAVPRPEQVLEHQRPAEIEVGVVLHRETERAVVLDVVGGGAACARHGQHVGRGSVEAGVGMAVVDGMGGEEDLGQS